MEWKDIKKALQRMGDALSKLKYGEVVIKVVDGKVAYLEIKKKIKLM